MIALALGIAGLSNVVCLYGILRVLMEIRDELRKR